ncbi:lectin-like protein, partial [Ichthyenterobacterium sp. W332]
EFDVELPGDESYQCIDDVPSAIETTATDNCDSDVTVEFTETMSGGIVTECPIDDASNHTIWITGINPLNAENKNWEAIGENMFVTYPNGTAKLSGMVENKVNSDQKFEYVVWLKDKRSYEEWTALTYDGVNNREEKLNAGTSVEITDQYLGWDYYEVDESKTNQLVGLGDYEGDVLTITHKPANLKWAVQVGDRASLQSEGYGLSMWMYLNGTVDGEPYSSHGDINISLGGDQGGDCIETQTSCEKTITRTWSVVDDCENLTEHIQVITINDDVAPTVDCPKDIEVDAFSQDAPEIDGFTTLGTYNNKYYYLSNSTVLGSEVITVCQSNGGNPVTVNNSDENEWIKNAVYATPGNNNIHYYIGLNDGAQEGEFVWADGDDCEYRNWFNNEPNDFNNNEDCVEVGFFSSDRSKWNDIFCTTGHKFVMEITPDCKGVVVNFETPKGEDNCDDNPEVVQIDGPASGSEFPVGTTEVTFMVIDACGNSSECSFEVVVNCPDTTDECEESQQPARVAQAEEQVEFKAYPVPFKDNVTI